MKSPRKRSSLLHAHRDNDLKHMLEYYNDKSKILQEPVAFEPIYEYEELPTDQVMLPKSTFDNFVSPLAKTRSEAYTRHPQQDTGKLFRTRGTFSREHASEMNKKLRDIRTSHRRRQSHKDECNQAEGDREEEEIGTAREVSLSCSGMPARKALFSSQEHRNPRSAARGSVPDIGSSGKQMIQFTKEGRGESSSWLRRSDGPVALRRNPHVIYQFESHLKAKRVDDNPRVLGSIIRQKFKNLERDNLFEFISGLIKRREK